MSGASATVEGELIRETSTISAHEEAIRCAFDALDFETIARDFREQGEFVFIPKCLPVDMVRGMAEEARRFTPEEIYRIYLPWTRKAGTVGQSAIAEKAPLLHALFRSPSILEFTSRLLGTQLTFKNDQDAHAAALYIYRRRGDHVAFHYDECGCENTASYTATFGVINETTSKVVFQLFRNDPNRPMKELFISMEPGSLVFFCGSKARHRVTPLGANEERVTYSFAHVREGKRLGGSRRFIENVKDAILYFGPKAIFQRNYR